MGRYVTIFRWKPETAMAFAKKWFRLFPGFPGPQKLKDAAGKFQIVTIEYSTANCCFVAVYNVADEDLPEVYAVYSFMADVCTMETFPVLSGDDILKANDFYGDIFPEIMDEMTKE